MNPNRHSLAAHSDNNHESAPMQPSQSSRRGRAQQSQEGVRFFDMPDEIMLAVIERLSRMRHVVACTLTSHRLAAIASPIAAAARIYATRPSRILALGAPLCVARPLFAHWEIAPALHHIPRASRGGQVDVVRWLCDAVHPTYCDCDTGIHNDDLYNTDGAMTADRAAFHAKMHLESPAIMRARLVRELENSVPKGKLHDYSAWFRIGHNVSCDGNRYASAPEGDNTKDGGDKLGYWPSGSPRLGRRFYSNDFAWHAPRPALSADTICVLADPRVSAVLQSPCASIVVTTSSIHDVRDEHTSRGGDTPRADEQNDASNGRGDIAFTPTGLCDSSASLASLTTMSAANHGSPRDFAAAMRLQGSQGIQGSQELQGGRHFRARYEVELTFLSFFAVLYKAASHAARYGRTDVLRYLATEYVSLSDPSEILCRQDIEDAARKGRLAVVELAHHLGTDPKSGECRCSRSIAIAAIEGLQRDVLVWMRAAKCKSLHCAPQELFKALDRGDVDHVTLLTDILAPDHVCTIPRAYVHGACANGHTHALAIAHARGFVDITPDFLESAIFHDRLDVLRWVVGKQAESVPHCLAPSEGIADLDWDYMVQRAAYHDRSAILTWLASHPEARPHFTITLARSRIMMGYITLAVCMHDADIAPVSSWDALAMAVACTGAASVDAIAQRGGTYTCRLLAAAVTHRRADTVATLCRHYGTGDAQAVVNAWIFDPSQCEGINWIRANVEDVCVARAAAAAARFLVFYYGSPAQAIKSLAIPCRCARCVGSGAEASQ